MYEIDVTGLRYLTPESCPEVHREVAAYNRQARWVNSGATVLDSNDTAAVLALLRTLEAMVAALSTDDTIGAEVREEAGTLLAGIRYAMNHLSSPAPTRQNPADPTAAYPDEQYFDG